MTEDNLFYQTHIFCCGNERPAGHPRGCCKEKGGVDLRNYLKSRVKEEGIDGVRVNMSGCLDRCELGAVMVVYPAGHWYTYATRDDINEIVDSLKTNTIVERLLLTNDQKELRAEQKNACGDNTDTACC